MNRLLVAALLLAACADAPPPASDDGSSLGGPRSLTGEADVGEVGAAGSLRRDHGRLTLSGAGADIWGKADAFHFVYETLSGDGSITARVASVDDVKPWTKAGVMMRASLAANAAHASMVVTPERGASFQRRTAAGRSSTASSAADASAPLWVRLERVGAAVTGSISSDGSTWTTVASDTIALGATAYVGLVMTSHEKGGLASAVLDHIKVAAPPAVDPMRVWPNAASQANSDPWLVQHHDDLVELRPKVLVVNLANNRSTDVVTERVSQMIVGLAEGSRYHGYSDATAPAVLRYQLVKVADLTDGNPSGCSAFAGKHGDGSFDYAWLFSQEVADRVGIADPASPGRNLPLAELVQRGLVHEVWVNSTAGCPDAFETIEYKQKYDASDAPFAGRFDPCAGNGCLHAEDVNAFAAAGRSLRVTFMGEDRGPGCAVHGMGHSFESMGRDGGPLPALARDFVHFGNFDFRKRLGASFSSWYELCAYGFDTNPTYNKSFAMCPSPLSGADEHGNLPCISYSGEDAVAWQDTNQPATHGQGSFAAFEQGCGNVHFPPNARDHYDDTDACGVASTCEHYGLHDGPGGADAKELYRDVKSQRYDPLLPDCQGGWQIYWRQSFPGLGTRATGADGHAMKSWWPYLFY